MLPADLTPAPLGGARGSEALIHRPRCAQGRDGRDDEKVAAQTVFSGDVPAAQSAGMAFALAVPDSGPIPYQGHRIRLVQLVRGLVGVTWGTEISDEMPVTVLSTYES